MIYPGINLLNLVQFKQHQGKILSTIKGLGGAKPPNPPPPGNCSYEQERDFSSEHSCIELAKSF